MGLIEDLIQINTDDNNLKSSQAKAENSPYDFSAQSRRNIREEENLDHLLSLSDEDWDSSEK